MVRRDRRHVRDSLKASRGHEACDRSLATGSAKRERPRGERHLAKLVWGAGKTNDLQPWSARNPPDLRVRVHPSLGRGLHGGDPERRTDLPGNRRNGTGEAASRQGRRQERGTVRPCDASRRSSL